MSMEDGYPVNPEISDEFRSFEEFCAENDGQELIYFKIVESNPLEMDPTTLAFSMRRLLRLSRQLREILIGSLDGAVSLDFRELLAAKGMDLDKKHAAALRSAIFAFRDCEDEERRRRFVRSLQLIAMSIDKTKLNLNYAESYTPPDEGWSAEDFGDDEAMLETVRSIENPRWMETEEN